MSANDNQGAVLGAYGALAAGAASEHDGVRRELDFSAALAKARMAAAYAARVAAWPPVQAAKFSLKFVGSLWSMLKSLCARALGAFGLKLSAPAQLTQAQAAGEEGVKGEVAAAGAKAAHVDAAVAIAMEEVNGFISSLMEADCIDKALKIEDPAAALTAYLEKVVQIKGEVETQIVRAEAVLNGGVQSLAGSLAVPAAEVEAIAKKSAAFGLVDGAGIHRARVQELQGWQEARARLARAAMSLLDNEDVRSRVAPSLCDEVGGWVKAVLKDNFHPAHGAQAGTGREDVADVAGEVGPVGDKMIARTPESAQQYPTMNSSEFVAQSVPQPHTAQRHSDGTTSAPSVISQSAAAYMPKRAKSAFAAIAVRGGQDASEVDVGEHYVRQGE